MKKEYKKEETYNRNEAVAFNHKCKDGSDVLSNLSYSKFNDPKTGKTFYSVEQYYMFHRLKGHEQLENTLLSYQGVDNGVRCRNYSHNKNVKPHLIMDEAKRIEIMREGLRLKAEQNKTFLTYLLATKQKPIVELNTWGVTDMWSARPRRGGGANILDGRNVLGKLLMELRDELRGGETKAVTTPVSDPVEPLTPDPPKQQTTSTAAEQVETRKASPTVEKVNSIAAGFFNEPYFTDYITDLLRADKGDFKIIYKDGGDVGEQHHDNALDALTAFDNTVEALKFSETAHCALLHDHQDRVIAYSLFT